MKQPLLKVISSTLLLTLVAPLSFAGEYKSAMFAFDGDQLVQQLGDTDRFKDSAVLYCQSEIDTAGVAKRTHCYEENGDSDLVGAVENAMAGLKFSPAEVEGEQVPVRMSYRVGLSLVDNAAEALLIPNLGTMQERYGRDYIAPQERLDVSDWYDRYSKNSWVNGEVFLANGPMSRVAATVDEKGKTDVVRALDTERAYRRDADIVKNALRRSRFIPGTVDGKAVPMGYVAVVNYAGENGEAVSSR